MKINFRKVHTAQDLIISAVIISAGAGLLFLNTGLGVIVIFCGVMSLLFYKAGYRRGDGDGPVFSKEAIDVAVSCRQSIKDFLDGKDVDPQLDPPGTGGVVRVEVYFNRKDRVAYAQLFDFANYAYEEATDIVELQSPQSDRFISKLG